MLYTVAVKNCTLSDKWLALIDKKAKKLVDRLPLTNTNPVMLRFNINRHRRDGYYDGDILLGLPHKPLYARFEGWESPEALIEKVFDHIFEELHEYRGKHLKSDSQYYSHESIRNHEEYFVTPQEWKTISVTQEKKKIVKKRRSKFSHYCKILVEEYIKPLGVTDSRVIDALEHVPRHLFVASKYKDEAYLDISLPTRAGQVVSQPSLVGIMVQALQLSGAEKVLEIGTGTGYMSAVLSHLAKEIYTIELLPSLAGKAKRVFEKLGYKNIHVVVGDGLPGLPQYAPFDAIVLDAAVPTIPDSWIDQLNNGGKIVAPIGKDYWHQHLMLGIKKDGKLTLRKLQSVQLTPLVEKTRNIFQEVESL